MEGVLLAKLGIELAVSTVARYMPRRRRPASPTWRAFLDNHLKDLVGLDFFVVPTATFGVLFGLIVLAHDRRRVLPFNVTANPTAEWTARQLAQAFPEDTAPRFLVRDRDSIYGGRFRETVEMLGIKEVITAARSPWQNPYSERLIGSIRRECLDHMVVLDEIHLLRILTHYFDYYHRSRCHLSLAGDAPQPRAVHGLERGEVVELPEVGGFIIDTSVPRRSKRATLIRPRGWATGQALPRRSNGWSFREGQASGTRELMGGHVAGYHSIRWKTYGYSGSGALGGSA